MVKQFFLSLYTCMMFNVYRYAVTKAIIFRKNMQILHNEKAKLLKTDITNGPYHVFGSHDKCDM